MKTINVYEYDELDDEVKAKVLDENRGINVDYFDWWHYVYEDAEQVGITIKAFDLYRSCDIELSYTREDAEAIVAQHGETCETYILADRLLKQCKEITDKIDLLEDDDDYEDKLADLDSSIDILEKEFKYDLEQEYIAILRHEYEWHTSDEAVADMIREWTFTKEGVQV